MGEWVRYYTDDGTPYYENLETQETSWDAPPSFIEATDDGMYEEEVEVGDLISLLFSSLLFSYLLFSFPFGSSSKTHPYHIQYNRARALLTHTLFLH